MLDPRTHQPFQLYHNESTTNNRPHHTNYNTNTNTTWEPTSSVFWPSKTDRNSKQDFEDDESGMCSPPLWRTSPPTTPSRDHARGPRTTAGTHYRSLSPASRTQAIVRGQRELMEMVRNMPDSNYELSLKDLVEHHRVQQQQQQDNTVIAAAAGTGSRSGSRSGSGRKVIGQVKRNGTVDRRSSGGGFYLKMAFPSFSLGFNKDKKKSSNNNNKKNNSKKKDNKKNNESSKVSPRPSVSDGSVKVEKEWWKKSPSGSGSGSRESDSGASSINSGSTKSSGSSSSNSSSSTSNSRHRNEKSGGRCWPCIPKSRRQTKK